MESIPPIGSSNKNNTLYYELLGIAKDATGEDIKRAWRKTALRLHPDKNQVLDPPLSPKSEGNKSPSIYLFWHMRHQKKPSMIAHSGIKRTFGNEMMLAISCKGLTLMHGRAIPMLKSSSSKQRMPTMSCRTRTRECSTIGTEKRASSSG